MRLPIFLVLLLRSVQPQFHAQTSIFVDDREVLITANLLHEDPLNVGKQACDELHIGEPQGELRDGRPRCATLIADELAESIFCNVSARGELDKAMREKGLEGPRGAFRFYHGTNYFDSEEYRTDQRNQFAFLMIQNNRYKYLVKSKHRHYLSLLNRYRALVDEWDLLLP